MSTDAIKKSLNSTAGLSQLVFSQRVENRISEIKSGNYQFDSAVDVELSQKSSSLSTSLNQSDPKAARLFAGYYSFLRYDRAARFVSNLEFSDRIQKSVQSKEEISKQVQKIVEAYTGEPAPTGTFTPIKGIKTIQDEIIESAKKTQAELRVNSL